MTHYFENNNDLKSEEKQINVIINNEKFTFITDNGVFSKKGLDFGTRTLLESLDIEKINGKILDFGCGYGPIGIYISRTTKSIVHMIDVNRRSLKLARRNVDLNHVNAKVYESDIYENVEEKFDYIISNPPIRVGNEILYKVLFDAKDHLKKNGELIIVVNKNQGAKSVAKNLEKEYRVEIISKQKGFYVIRAIND